MVTRRRGDAEADAKTQPNAQALHRAALASLPGCMGSLGDPVPVVSLRSTTGYHLGCLRHPPPRVTTHPRATGMVPRTPGMVPSRARHDLDASPPPPQRAPRKHPGGMPGCSRWLSEATPPDPMPPSSQAPRQGCQTGEGNGHAETRRRGGRRENTTQRAGAAPGGAGIPAGMHGISWGPATGGVASLNHRLPSRMPLASMGTCQRYRSSKGIPVLVRNSTNSSRNVVCR